MGAEGTGQVNPLTIFIAALFAFVFAMISALSFFSGQASTGLVFGAGAWLLVWWSGRHLREHKEQ